MARRTAAALLVAVLAATFAGAPARAAEPAACTATAEAPETLQVAWVSRLGARAGARTALPVVRVADLRRLVEANDRDATRVLRALGLIGKRAEAKGAWKVTVFDVKRDWLCRPIADGEDGPAATTVTGMAVCDRELQKGAPGVRARAWSGCGYLLDTATGKRTLDLYRVEWSSAVAWGFCVLPLNRFLGGA